MKSTTSFKQCEHEHFHLVILNIISIIVLMNRNGISSTNDTHQNSFSNLSVTYIHLNSILNTFKQYIKSKTELSWGE